MAKIGRIEITLAAMIRLVFKPCLIHKIKVHSIEKNYGREKVIDLVNYRRELEMASAVSTGTDGVIEESQRKRYTEKQREVQRYAEALHGTLSGTSTVRKILAIREQIGNI